MTETQLNLYQKLAKIRKLAEVVQKNKKGFNYRYASIEEILAKVVAGMDKYGVSLIPQVVHETASAAPFTYTKTKADRTGKIIEEAIYENIVSADMVYRWVNNDNPLEFIDVPWFITGAQQDPAQAFGSGLTYGLRQFLTQYFQIAQPEDDPDNWRSRKKEAEVEESRVVCEEIIAVVDTKLKAYLARYPDQTDNVKAMVSKYVKGGNYFNISEPKLAAKLLEEINNTLSE